MHERKRISLSKFLDVFFELMYYCTDFTRRIGVMFKNKTHQNHPKTSGGIRTVTMNRCLSDPTEFQTLMWNNLIFYRQKIIITYFVEKNRKLTCLQSVSQPHWR